ncbi:hypothetical protein [Pseudorhodobacter ferrugineus]|uniref:hypothetical protein n=1 Tax=Pseudorhodobacter ferrugineus TaxID=77008 RepID=UPI0003B7201E|nr:hypothetical protein [Pseudorhodobacter ferrugineus]
MVELLFFVFVIAGIVAPLFARNWNMWGVMLGVGIAVLIGLFELMKYSSKGAWLEDTVSFLVVATAAWFGIWGMAIQAVVLVRGPDHVWSTRAIGWGMMAVVTVLALLQT